MKILIDADGCPVVDLTLSLGKRYGIPCLILCDTSHEFHRDGAQTLVFDKGTDSVDYALVNRIQPGDLVITQDYGLASMSLARGASVLHQDGWEYTSENIDALLLVRHDARKARMAGKRLKASKKRSPVQNDAFSYALETLLQTTIQG